MVATDHEAETVMAELEPSVDFLQLTNFIHLLNAPFGGIGIYVFRNVANAAGIGARRKLFIEARRHRGLRLPVGYRVWGKTMSNGLYRSGSVELRVHQDGEDILIYSFKAIDEAAEMFDFLRDFFPDAKFVIQPLMH